MTGRTIPRFPGSWRCPGGTYGGIDPQLMLPRIAAALGISVESVARDWRLAKVWLMRQLTRGRHHGL